MASSRLAGALGAVAESWPWAVSFAARCASPESAPSGDVRRLRRAVPLSATGPTRWAPQRSAVGRAVAADSSLASCSPGRGLVTPSCATIGARHVVGVALLRPARIAGPAALRRFRGPARAALRIVACGTLRSVWRAPRVRPPLAVCCWSARPRPPRVRRLSSTTAAPCRFRVGLLYGVECEKRVCCTAVPQRVMPYAPASIKRLYRAAVGGGSGVGVRVVRAVLALPQNVFAAAARSRPGAVRRPFGAVRYGMRSGARLYAAAASLSAPCFPPFRVGASSRAGRTPSGLAAFPRAWRCAPAGRSGARSRSVRAPLYRRWVGSGSTRVGTRVSR